LGEHSLAGLQKLRSHAGRTQVNLAGVQQEQQQEQQQ